MAAIDLIILVLAVGGLIYWLLRPLRNWLERRIAEGIRRKKWGGRIIDVRAEPPQSRKKE
jgi:predicted PurR-regulated permease PerM